MNPKKVLDFIDSCRFNFVLGAAVQSLYKAQNASLTKTAMHIAHAEDEKVLQHLKDARDYINIEIRRINARQGALSKQTAAYVERTGATKDE